MNPINVDNSDVNINIDKIKRVDDDYNKDDEYNKDHEHSSGKFNVLYHMKQIIKQLEPQELSIDINKEEIVALIQSKSLLLDKHKTYVTIVLYTVFIISFAVSFYYYQAQYIVTNKIFPLNQIESGWGDCTPITTISNSNFGNNYPPYNSTYSALKFLEVNMLNVYYDNIETCSSQLTKEKVCNIQNICGDPMSGLGSYFCNGQVMSCQSGDDCNNEQCSCNNNFIYISFGETYWQGFPYDVYLSYCNMYYNASSICQQIYNLENPYNCSNKVYNSFITSISLAFSSSLLVFQVALRVLVMTMKRFFKRFSILDSMA